jgi:sugar phosphate permease
MTGEPFHKHSFRVLGLLSALSIITYLDRVCISVAGPRMQDALHIGPEKWGWVTGVFTLAYAVFELPSGTLGDRIGARRVLTRIVLWWSAFTSLTGAISSFSWLLLARFCFGMGEAGAYPNMGVVIARWFPAHARTSAWGVVLMASQIGGAIAPLLVVPVQIRYGWRASFFAFGLAGVLWAIVWWRWFSDSPGNAADEPAKRAVTATVSGQRIPWKIAVRSLNLWALMVLAACVGWTMSFFQAWLGTYLIKGRGFAETGLLLASLPFLVGAISNLCGGFIADFLVRRLGLRWGRRAVGMAGYGSAALLLAAALLAQQKMLAVLFLSLAYGGMTVAQPTILAICLDIGRRSSGAVTGAMNSASYLAAFLSAVSYGYIAKSYGYGAPFIPMIAFMIIGTLLLLKIDASEQIGAERIRPRL